MRQTEVWKKSVKTPKTNYQAIDWDSIIDFDSKIKNEQY